MINTRVFAVPKQNSKSVGGVTTANSSTIKLDTQLSDTSQNGVQNKVIYAAIIELLKEITNSDNTLEILRNGQTVTINSNTWKFDTNTGNLYYNGVVNVNSLLSNYATIGNLSGTDLDFTNADIDNLNSSDAIIENLTVTKAAHFFELIIDQIKSTQGQIIITAANAKLDRVTQSSGYFRCYWKNTDGDRTIYNQFSLNDLVVCQSFNLDRDTNGLTNNLFTNINQYWSASNTFQTFNNSGVTVNDGEAVILPTANTCFLAQSIEFEPETQYTLKWDMKQDKASECDVSVLIHNAVIDKTRPYKTNVDNYVQQEDGYYDAFDMNLTDEYKTFYITFTTKSTLPEQSNLEFVCVNLVNDPADLIKTYITNPTLLKSSQKNKYYWSKVINTGIATIDDETYNYIDLSTSDYDTISNGVPEAGDEIAQLGNKTNKDRQAAIVISAYNSQFLDPEIKAPSIVQYSGINDYNLSNHRLNVISKSFNLFKGNFTSVAGADLEQQISNNTSQIQQTNQAITTEVSNRIAGDRKSFPIQKPFYSYDGDVVTDYLTDPIRYNGGLDIYSQPVSVAAGNYILRFYSTVSTVSSLENYFQLCTFGNTYPSSIGDDYNTFPITLSQGTNTMKAKGGANLYEYTANITISDNDKGYFCVNFWYDGEYIYIPDETEEFETNYSRITQTNNRITTQVANLNGQISSIDQKADSIELAVNETNVRLDNGQFTINADTEINGALTVTSADKGFILNSSGGNTYIVGDSIGSYYDFKNKQFITNTYQTAAVVNATSDSPQFTFTVNLGSLPLNTAVDFMQMRASFKGSTGTITYNSYNYTIALYKGTTPVKSMNGTNTELPSDVRYTTNSVAGSYTAQITLTPQLNLSEYPTQVEASFYFQLKIYTQTFNIIGVDGLASNFGTDKTFYVGNEGTYIRYNDDNVLKISTAGIQKYAGDTYGRAQQKGYLPDTCISRYLSEYSPINGVAVRMVTSLNSNTSQCYLQPNDEMIVFNLTSSDNSKRLNIFLGNPSGKIGRRVYLKKTNSYGSLYVFGTDNSTSDTSANYTIKTADNGTTYWRDEINDASLMYVSDGTYWNEYYCG